MIGVGYYYLLFLLFVALPVAAIGAYTIGISPMADPTKSRQCCVVLFAVSLVATCSAVIFPPQQGEDGDSDNYKLYISAPKLLSSLVAGLLATAILKLFPPPSHSFPVAMIVSMGPFYLFPQQVSQVLSVMDLAKSKDASQSEYVRSSLFFILMTCQRRSDFYLRCFCSTTYSTMTGRSPISSITSACSVTSCLVSSTS